PGTTLAVVAAPGGVWAASGRGVYFIERARPLRIASSVQLGSDVNDLAIAGSWLYAATTTGITQIDAVDRARPAVGKQLNTTSGSALSVAILGSHLYAADGDRTIEVYAIGTPTIPQKVGTFDSLPRSLTVHASGDNLIVSDGQRAEVFAGSGATMTKLGSLPFGATAVAAGAGSLRFVAGADRTVRAINVLAPVPTVLATAETDLTTGTVNRVTALASTGDLVVAAAGDAGLAAWSLSSLVAPFPASSIEIGAIGSAWISAERAVVALPAGGLRRYTESNGIMNPGPTFGAGSVWKIQDGDGTAVLASAGSTLQLWDSSAATPTSISSATLAGAITGAALSGPRKAAVLLADKTVWSVDLSQSPATVTKLAVAGAPSFIAASSGGIAIAEITPAGNTLVRYYPGGETSSVVEATIEGTSNSGLALSSNGTAAAATFKGIALVDLAAGGAPRYIAGSNTAPVRDLEIEGANVLALESGRLQVRRLSDGALLSAWPLTSDGEYVQASGNRAIVAGANGFTVIDTSRTPVAPVELSLPQDAPRFFRSVERDGALLWLVEKSRADLLALDGHGIPLTAESLSYDETIVAAAAARGNLYTLSASGKLLGRDTAGRVVAQLAINEGADQQMNGMQTVGESLWISLTRGCGAGGCEKKTLVVDAASGLVITATLPGGILDVVWSGDRAWALSDTPREVRIYDIAKPSTPSLFNSASATGDPVSIARAAGFVWTLGSTLKRYSETLQPQAEFLAAWTADPTGRVTYVDQKVRATGDCLIIAGREHAPRVYNVAGGTPQEVAAPAAAGAMRDV
ncbi:MAG TPA: hypothetical protein VFV54_00400, partial [Thermoanaerobaculia bacterium]|nr:hypothetical protein [Thermoanaerobaculia bacterium]